MKPSREFIIAIVLIIAVGLGILGYTYWQSQQLVSNTTELTQVVPKTKTQTVEEQLSDIESDLAETTAVEKDFDTSEIEDLESDLDPSQFDIL